MAGYGADDVLVGPPPASAQTGSAWGASDVMVAPAGSPWGANDTRVTEPASPLGTSIIPQSWDQAKARVIEGAKDVLGVPFLGGAIKGAGAIAQGAVDIAGRLEAEMAQSPEEAAALAQAGPNAMAGIPATPVNHQVPTPRAATAAEAAQMVSGADVAGAAVSKRLGQIAAPMAPKPGDVTGSVEEAVGSAAPYIVSGPAAPLTMATAGAGEAAADAEAHGATVTQKDQAMAQNAILQFIIGGLPISHALDMIPLPMREGALRYMTRVGMHAAGGAAQFAGMQAGENVVASQTFDPRRDVMQGVPESAATGAAFGGVPALIPHGEAKTAETLGAENVPPGGGSPAGRSGPGVLPPMPGEEPPAPLTPSQPPPGAGSSAFDQGARVITHLEGGVNKDGTPRVSKAGAIGEWQVMPGTAKQYMGQDFDTDELKDPNVNRFVGMKIYGDLWDRFNGDLTAIAIAYNGGPGRADTWLKKGPGTALRAVPDKSAKGGVRYDVVPADHDESWLPLETQRYAANARRLAGSPLPAAPAVAATPEAAPEAPTAPQTQQPQQTAATTPAADQAPQSMVDQALADIKAANARPTSPNLFTKIRQWGGMRTRTADGGEEDVATILDNAKPYRVINNGPKGLTPDDLRGRLQDEGWFGPPVARDTGDHPGDSVDDLNALIARHLSGDKVYHPDSADARNAEMKAQLDKDMVDAGIDVNAPRQVQAEQLAAWRQNQLRDQGTMDALRATADALGVPYHNHTSYEELLGDVVERQAIQTDPAAHDEGWEGWAPVADHAEGRVHAELTADEHDPGLTAEEHAWLSHPDRGLIGEQEVPGEPQEAGGRPEEVPGAPPAVGPPRPRPSGRGENAGTRAEGVVGPAKTAADLHAAGRQVDLVKVWLEQAERELAHDKERFPHDAEHHAALEHRIVSLRKMLADLEGGSDAIEGMSDEELLAELNAPTEPGTEKQTLAHGEKVEQAVMPGMEQSAKQAAQARGEGGLKAKAPQQEPGGLFGPPPEPDLFAPPVEPPAPRPPETQPQDRRGYGDKNTVFTKSDADAARARIQAKLAARKSFAKDEGGALDPEMMLDGITLAGYHIEAGARSFADFAAAMLGDLGEEVRPYLRSWYEAVRHYPGVVTDGMTSPDRITDEAVADAGKHVSDQQPGVEPGGGAGTAADQAGAGVVPPGPGGAERGSGGEGGEAGGGRGAVASGGGVSDRSPPAVGESGAGLIRPQEPEILGDTPGGNESLGSRIARDEGVQPDRIPTERLGQASDEDAHLTPVGPDAEPGWLTSSNAPAVPDDLEAALPTLFPAQRGDVAFAEARFAKDDGHGVMFTNGTGTGKTYTGTGLARRFVDRGETDILVVAPSQGILNAWGEAMGRLGIPFKVLDSTATHGGEGPVGTTYANMTANRHLADRDWRLLIADESHNLMQSEGGEETTALRNFRAISNHPNGLYDKALMRMRAEHDEVVRLQAAAKLFDNGPHYEAWEAASKALDEKAKAMVAQLVTQPRAKAVFLSATPFAYDKNIDYADKYLFDYGPQPTRRGGYNQPSAQQAFMMQHFGYRMRFGKLTRPENVVDSDIMERQFHEWLRKEGSLSGRMLDVDKDYDRKFVLVDDAVGKKIDDALQFLNEARSEDLKTPEGRPEDFRRIASIIAKRFDYLSRQRLLEAIKAEHAVPLIKAHQALGRKVVVFHDFNEGGGFSPFQMGFSDEEQSAEIKRLQTLYEEFRRRNPYVDDIDDRFAKLQSPLNTLRGAFGDKALIYNGTESKGNRARAIAKFNEDGSGHDLIVIQAMAGSAGISLHDTTGKHQRALINLGMPGRPTLAIQQEGRIRRIGQASDSLFRYMNTGTNWERFTFASRIAERAGTAENLGMGDQARTLRDSFINAFLDSAPYPPARGEGKGGAEADRNLAKIATDWDKAKAFYYGQQKKSGRRSSREGIDYFPTPEPLGLKMVEWADIKPGDHVLEPSAGHGAIGRWFPENTNRTLVEPEPELASKAALVAPGAKVLVHPFESLHAVNKYDAIVMNPPFGVGGKMAIEHMERAAAHLRDGGRLVALIPEGPMADKRYEDFTQSAAAKNLYPAGYVKLPRVTFERAGTQVSARVVILEKQTGPNRAPNEVRHIDLTGEDKINGLFDRLEHITMDPRSSPVAPEPIPQAQAADIPTRRNEPEIKPASETPVTFKIGETTHTKTGAQLFVAARAERVEAGEYKAMNEMARRYGGYYSAWRGPGAIPGFQFKSAAARDAFVAEMRGETSAPGAGPSFQRPEQKPVFYSALERTVERLPQRQAKADQWLSTLRNAPGVKREEMEWSGVEDWLKMWGGAAVTKDAVQAFVRDNGVKVEETVLGGEHEDDVRPSPEVVARHAAEWDALNKAIRAKEQEIEDLSRRGEYDKIWDANGSLNPIRAQREELHRQMVRETIEARGLAGEAQYDDWTLPGAQDYRELLFTLPKEANPPATHWDTPGVMAHVRFDTRTAPDGKKVLFIEEVQSDWHQKGRDEGYNSKSTLDQRVAAVNASDAASKVAVESGRKVLQLADELASRRRIDVGTLPWRRSYHPGIEDDPLRIEGKVGMVESWLSQNGWKTYNEAAGHALSDALDQYHADALRHVEARMAERRVTSNAGIPNAPFKTTWPALVMKRMIRWAADNGFDRIAWTTGDQQAERYSLATHVGEISAYTDNDGSSFTVKLGNRAAQDVLVRNGMASESQTGRDIHMTPDELKAAFGDAVANRIITEGAPTDRAGGPEVKLEGHDLQVGGEGMRAFYDRNLVNITNDLIKRYGSKVEQKPVVLRELTGGVPTDLLERDLAGHRRAGNEAAVRQYEEALRGRKEEEAGEAQPGFDITDKMREAASEGLPLFQRGEQAPPTEMGPDGKPWARWRGSRFGPPREQWLTHGLTGAPANPLGPHADVIAKVEAEIKRLAGPGVDVRSMRSMDDRESGPVLGAAWSRRERGTVRQIVAWSLESDNPVATGRHEALHALRQAGLFTPEEWKTLERESVRSWMDKYDIEKRYPDDPWQQQAEEGIAEAVSRLAADRFKDVPAAVRPLLVRIEEALHQIAAAVRRVFGADATARDILDRIESGEIRDRQATHDAPAQAAAASYQRARTDAEAAPEPERRRWMGWTRTVDEALGSVPDKVGHAIASRVGSIVPASLKESMSEIGDNIRMGLNPMAAGSERAQAVAKDFANQLRAVAWRWGKVDDYLAKHFTPEQRTRMALALDEHGVILRRGQTPGPNQGLNTLDATERAVVEDLNRRQENIYSRARAVGMHDSEGLEFHFPRMIVDASGKPVTRVKSKDLAKAEGDGRNLFTATGQLKQRKHETIEETEAAAREKFGPGTTVVRDIRAVGIAARNLEQAIAGRMLINNIRALSKEAGGADVISETGGSGFFTIPGHPAFRDWSPKLIQDPTGALNNQGRPKMIVARDQAGDMIWEAKPLYVADEFEGPLKAVMSSPDPALWRKIMNLKAKTMSVIMYSPPIHNMVIYGKAFPAMVQQDKLGAFTFKTYRDGNAVKNDETLMNRAMAAGLVPIGRRGAFQDITGVANQALGEGGVEGLAPGRSWTAQLLAATLGRTPEQKMAIKRGVDVAGDWWHNKFLWDRVADLQAGLWKGMSDHWTAEGIDPATADRMAAYFANMYAGSVPVEAMSKLSRGVLNGVLFSRSFHTTNVGGMKAALAGLPTDVQAQIRRDSPEMFQRAQGAARAKAASVLALDLVTAQVARVLAAGAVAFILGQAMHWPQDNEEGKKARVFIGYRSDGTATYMNVPFGKYAEEVTEWAQEPLTYAKRIMFGPTRLGLQYFSNDIGYGRKAYDPYDKSLAGLGKNFLKGLGLFAGSVLPMDTFQSVADVISAPDQQARQDALAGLAGTMTGFTVSHGYPHGPAAGDIARVREEHDYNVQQARPEILRRARLGDIAGANALMDQVGIYGRERGYMMRYATNPNWRPSKTALRAFAREGSPQDRALMAADLARERADRQQQAAQ